MKAKIENNLILVRADYADKDRLKAIPGGRWHKPKKCWCYPAGPMSAKRLLATFPAMADICPELRDMARAIKSAKEAKDDKNLVSPKGLRTTLWHHQLVAYNVMLSLGSGMLTMDMGTGKTLTAIALHTHHGGPTLVLCPAGGGAVLEMWREQILLHVDKVDEGQALILNKGTSKKKAEHLRASTAEIVVINYESCWRDHIDKAILEHDFNLMIMDESARLKGPGSKASRFCAKLADKIPYRVALTGRPMPHSPLDIYGQMRAVDKSVFGTSFERFRQRYAVMGGFGGYQVLGYREQEEMASLLESVSYTVMSEDVQDLPEKHHIRIPVEMDKECRKIYAAMEKDWVTLIDNEEISVQHCLTRLIRLQQITSGYLPDGEGRLHSTSPNKCLAAMELIEEMAGEPVVVFCRFTHDIHEIRKNCLAAGITSGELSGQHNDLDDWQDSKFQVLCVQIQSGSLAVDFTRARYGIYYSIGYSLGDFEQSEKRMHRPGQKRAVTYYHLVVKDSVDEKIYAALTARKNVVDCIYTLMKEV